MVSKLKEHIKTKNFFLRLSLALLFFFIFYIYFVFMPVDYNFDGTVFSNFLRYALYKDNVKLVLSPHQLLYYPVCFLIYKCIAAVSGVQMLEYYFLQLLSLTFGMLTLVMIYNIFRAAAIDTFYRVSGLFLVAFSFLFWLYSVESEVHMPGFFFMTAGIYYLFFKSRGASRLELKYLTLAALLFSLSAGFHLTNGLIVFSILAFFIYRKTGLKQIIRFYLLYGCFLVLPYIWLKIITGIDLTGWVTDTLTGKSVFTGYSTIGTSYSTWRSLSLDSVLSSVVSVKDSILKSSGGPGFLSILSIILFLAVLVIPLSVLVMQAMRKKRGLAGTSGSTAPAVGATMFYLLAWLLPFFIFFTFWQPGNYEFKLNTVVPLLIACVFSLSYLPRQKAVKALFTAICLLVSGLNLVMSIQPLSKTGNNPNYLVAKAIGEKTPENSIIVIAGAGKTSYLHGKIYIPYFALREVLILDWRLGKGFTFEQLAGELESKFNNGQPVYFLSEVGSLTAAMKNILRFHKKKEADYIRFLGQFPGRERIDLVAGYYLERVTGIVSSSRGISP